MTEIRITEARLRVSSRHASAGICGCAAIIAVWVAVIAPAAPAAAPSTGRVVGTVRLLAASEAGIASGAYPTRRVSRPAPRPAEIANVIVFLRRAAPAGSREPLPARHLQMIQKDESFMPRVLAVTRGSTVDFPNFDPYFHNVFSLSRGAAFDLGRFPRGESRSRTFTRAGLVKVYCHLHSHMSASIMVFDHPHFVVPEGDGTFALENVPAGDQHISAWHERIGESAKPITIEPGRTANVEFSLPVEGR